MIERETHNKAVNLPRIPGRQGEIRRTWAALDAELDRIPSWLHVVLLYQVILMQITVMVCG